MIVVDKIRLYWNTLLPYIQKVARMAEERAEVLEKAELEAVESPQLFGTR